MAKAGVPFRLILEVGQSIDMIGISAARNRLLENALRDPECKYVANLSNDLFDFSPNWLRTMVRYLDNNLKVGCVNGINFANYSDSPGEWKTWTISGKEVHYGDTFPDEESTSVAGQISLVKAKVLRATGLYDLGYGLGSYEGLDLGLRIQDVGYSIFNLSSVQAKHDIQDGNCKILGAACQNDLNSPYHRQKWGDRK